MLSRAVWLSLAQPANRTSGHWRSRGPSRASRDRNAGALTETPIWIIQAHVVSRRLHYNAARGSACGSVRVIAKAKGLLSLAFEEVCDPAGQFLSGVFRYVDGVATSARTIVTFWRTHRDLKRSDNCAAAALNRVGVNF
jgi:hypothetical protein